jgi:mediator of RNA polymerase II transcription subunit 16
VRALIDWGLPKTGDKVNPATLPLSPVIRTKHLAVTSWLHDVPGEILNASHMEPSMVHLSHLEFLPACGDSSGRMTPPTIIAIRSHLPVSISHFNQDVHTTVDRWEVREKPQSIHPAFEQLSSRRSSLGSQPGVIASLSNPQTSLTCHRVYIF